jgi:hypothetical protein
LILKSTIESILNSTTQPNPESTIQPVPDTRPIWPNRPELIYQRYLANKEAWLTAHPEVQPAQYRTAQGRRNYSKRWLNENRRNLGFWRLDLQTETLLTEDSPNWTDEEVTAWLDWDAQETIEVENQVENELVAARGFGQSRERGIQGLWGQIEGDIQTKREQYRFR